MVVQVNFTQRNMEQFVHSDSATVMLFHFSFGLFCLGYQGRDICGTLVLFRFKMIATIFVTVFLRKCKIALQNVQDLERQDIHCY